MKQTRKAIALLLSVLMTLSVFAIVGNAEGTYTVTFYNRAQNEAQTPVAISTQEGISAGGAATDPAAGKSEAELKQLLAYPTYMEKSFNKWGFDG